MDEDDYPSEFDPSSEPDYDESPDSEYEGELPPVGGNEIYKEITSIPLLSRDQEHIYAIQYRNGSPEEKKTAKNKLILHNMRFVMKIAMSFHPKAEDRDDYIQAGYLGLDHAIDLFDPEKAFRLTTYAHQWICVYIKRHIENTDRNIRLPIHVRNGILLLQKAKDELEIPDIFFTESQLKALSEKTNLPVDKIIEYEQYLPDTLSLDIQSGDDDNPASLGDFINDTTDAANPEASYEKDELSRIVNAMLDKHLTEKEANVIRLRSGLGADGKVCTLDEIGKTYGVTRERIRQIEAKALRKLRENADDYGLDEYL